MEYVAAEILGPNGEVETDVDTSKEKPEGSAPSAAETGAAKTEGAKPSSPEKKRDEGQERFDKLTRDLYELRGELDRGRFEREERDKKIAALEAQLTETAKRSQVAPDNLPTLESVGYDEAKHLAAVAAHFEKVAESKGEAAAQKLFDKFMAQQSAHTTATDWDRRQADFAKTNPDYVAKVQNARMLPISKEMQNELMQMENGPGIALFLVENSDKAAAIMRLPLAQQMREVGRIEAQLEAKKPAAKPLVSQAPPPAPKVDATDVPTNVSTTDPESDKLSDSEWVKAENARLQRKLKKAR